MIANSERALLFCVLVFLAMAAQRLSAELRPDSVLMFRVQATPSNVNPDCEEQQTRCDQNGSDDDGLNDGRPGASPAAPGSLAGIPPEYRPGVSTEHFELVMLKYADVSEVVGLLSGGSVKSNDVFVPSEPGFGSNGLTGQPNQTGSSAQQTRRSDEPLGQRVDASMAVDRRLNAIWLTGSPERIAELKRMIALIDIPTDSVMLETQMIELTESGQKAVGIDFTNANGQLGVFTVSSGALTPPGTTQGCDENGFCSGHVTSTAFQAALYAQIQNGNGRILSKPRVAALSGSTAQIVTGDALPILTAITLSGVNGVSQQVQYVNVGVTLQIAPRVSADGFVTSHVYAVVSSVTGFSQGYPTISQRQAETTATVRDGDSFVIGGLTRDQVLDTRTRVPLLGDLPIIGGAFRTNRTQRTNTELYIIVTPRVVHRVKSKFASVAPAPLDRGGLNVADSSKLGSAAPDARLLNEVPDKFVASTPGLSKSIVAEGSAHREQFSSLSSAVDQAPSSAPEVFAAPERSSLWRVQLGAFRSRAAAEALYKRVAASSVLAGAAPFYVSAAGIVRLQIGSFKDRSTAAAVCTRMKPNPCFPIASP